MLVEQFFTGNTLGAACGQVLGCVAQRESLPRGIAGCRADDVVDAGIGAEGQSVVIDGLEKMRQGGGGVGEAEQARRQLKLRFGRVW